MIDRDAALRILEDVKANQRRLEECEGPHEFVLVDINKPWDKSRCAKCGGEVSVPNLYWYKHGLAHGRLP